MAKANDNGWDFVEVGKTYLLIESGFYSLATVLDDNSSSEYYSFKMRFEKSTGRLSQPIIEISHGKNFSGVCSGMVSIFELDEYTIIPDVIWKHEFDNYKIDFSFDVFRELVNVPEKADFIFGSCINPDLFKNIKPQHNSLTSVFLNLFRKKQIPYTSIGTDVFQLEPARIWVRLKNPVAEFYFTKSKNNTIEFDLKCPLLGLDANYGLYEPLVNVDLIYNDAAKNILAKLNELIDLLNAVQSSEV